MIDNPNNNDDQAQDFLDLEGVEVDNVAEPVVDEGVGKPKNLEDAPVEEQVEDKAPEELEEPEVPVEEPVVDDTIEEIEPEIEVKAPAGTDPADRTTDLSRSGSKFMTSEEDEFLPLGDEANTPTKQEEMNHSQTFAEGLWGGVVGASQVSGDIARGAIKGVANGEISRGLLQGAAKGVAETAQFITFVGDNLRKIDPLTHLGDIIGISDPVKREELFNQSEEAFKQIDEIIEGALPTDSTVGNITSSVAQLGVGIFGAGKFRKGWEAIAKGPKVLSNLTEGGLAMMLGMDDAEKNLSNIIQEHPETANWFNGMLAIQDDDGYGTKKFKQFAEGAVGVGAAELLIKAMPMIAKLAPFGWKTTDKGVAMKTAGDQLVDYSKFLPKKQAKELESFVGNSASLKDISLGTKEMVIDTYRAYLVSASLPLQVVGGLTQVALRVSDTAFARGVTKLDKVVGGKILGGKPGVQAGELMANIQGMKDGFFQSGKAVKDVWRTGDSAFEGIMRGEVSARGAGAHQLKLDPSLKVSKLIDGIATLPNVIYKAIGVVDEMATYTGFSGAVRSLSWRKSAEKLGIKDVTRENYHLVLKEQQRMLKNPKEIIESGISTEAGKIAQKIGLKESPGEFAQKLNDIRNTIPLGRIYVPIFKTIGNLTRQGFERFPGSGLMFKGPAEKFAKGGADRAEVVGSMMTGLSVMSSFTILYESGTLNGAGEFGKWGTQNAAGFIPYSFNLEGQNISYNNLDVVGVMYKTMADFMGAIDVLSTIVDDEDQDLVDAITGASLYMGRAFANNAYGQSMIEFVDLLGEGSEKTVGKTARRELNDIIANLAVPNIVSRFSQAFDPYQREADTLLEKIMKRVPGLSLYLPIKYDVYGRDMENSREGVIGALNPLPATSKTAAKFDDFIVENGINVTPLYKTQTFDTVKMDMRKHPEVFSALNKTIGELKIGGKTMSETLEDLVTGERYLSKRFRDDLPENQAKKVQGVVSKFRRQGKAQLLRENEEFRLLVRNEKRLVEKDRRDAERIKRGG